MNLIKKLILPLLVFILLSAGISFFLIHQKPAQAETQNLAAQQCTGSAPAHAMLVIDRSGSMKDKIGNSGATKLSKAKEAAKLFVDKLKNNNAKTKIGMAKFSDNAQLDKALGTDWNGLKTSIDALTGNGETCAACGLRKAKEEINSKKENGVKNVVIFLTDGKANHTLAGKRDGVKAKQEAVDEASAIRQGGTLIYSIGLGPEVQADFLKQVAGDPNRYYSSPTTEQLNQIYNEIAVIVGGGSISGTVFIDANGNGNKDQGENGASGWTVNLSGQITATTTSGDGGLYKFEGLCDGSYTVSEEQQQGWTQTKPTNPGNYPVTISSTNSTVTDKDFGNVQKPACNRGATGEVDGTCTQCVARQANSCSQNNGTKHCSFTTHNVLGDFCNPHGADQDCTVDACEAGSSCNNGTCVAPSPTPTSTPEPGVVQLSFVLGLDGTGGENVADNTKGTGDYTNRNLTFGNSDPNYTKSPAQVCIYPNGQNDGNFCLNPYPMDLNYNGSTELWIGTLPLPSTVRPGNYSIKIRTQKYLIRKVGLDIPTALPNLNTSNQNAIWSLVEGANQIGTATNQKTHSNLMVGDVDGADYGNNALNSVDWSLIKDCSVFKAANVTCANSARADLNADGKVDQVDLNYFIRENSVGDGGLPQAGPSPSPSVSPSSSPTSSPTQSPSSTPTPSPSSTPVGQKLSKLTCPSNTITVTKANKEISAKLTNNSGNIDLDGRTITFTSSVVGLIINPTSDQTGVNGNAKTEIKLPQSFSGQGNGTLTATFAGGNNYATSTCNVNLTWNIN